MNLAMRRLRLLRGGNNIYMSDNFFVVYFPYISLGDLSEIDFGFAKVWNFDKKKNDYISNSHILEKMEKIVGVNVELGGDRIGDVGIISIGEIDFRKYNKDEERTVEQICLILFLSCIAKNNMVINHANLSMVTAENFDVIYQSFTPEGETFSEKTGLILQINAGGYDFSRTKFQKPRYIYKPLRFVFDNDMFHGLLKLNSNKPRVFKRTMNATRFIMEGYYNTPYLSRSARLLLHVSAFEIFLSLPFREQRKVFKEKIREVVSFDGEQEYSYWTKLGTSSKRLRGTMKEIWVDRFYMLRNDIIHGNNPDDDKFLFEDVQNHLDISILFFVFLVKKQIEKSLVGVKYGCTHEIIWDNGFLYKFSMKKFFEMNKKAFRTN